MRWAPTATRSSSCAPGSRRPSTPDASSRASGRSGASWLLRAARWTSTVICCRLRGSGCSPSWRTGGHGDGANHRPAIRDGIRPAVMAASGLVSGRAGRAHHGGAALQPADGAAALRIRQRVADAGGCGTETTPGGHAPGDQQRFRRSFHAGPEHRDGQRAAVAQLPHRPPRHVLRLLLASHLRSTQRDSSFRRRSPARWPRGRRTRRPDRALCSR